MQNLIPISLLIGDRTYRIKIEAGEEESIRNMAKKLNDQIAGFKLQYGGKTCRITWPWFYFPS